MDKPRLARLLEMLSSDFTMERATAGKMIADAARSKGQSVTKFVEDIFGVKVNSFAQQSTPVPPQRKEYMAREASYFTLSQLDDTIRKCGYQKLDSWQAEFTRDILFRWPRKISTRQAHYVKGIIEKLTPRGNAQ